MSIANLTFLLLNLFLSHPLPIKQPIKIDQHNISTPKFGVQDLEVTHYDCFPKQIANMQYYKLNKIGECKIKPADFQILPAQVQIFSQIRTPQVRGNAVHAKLSDRVSFSHKIALKRGFRFDHDKWYVKNIERPFFPTEIEDRKKLARVGLISKLHYHRQIIQFDVLDDPRWQANIEAKQGRFQIDRYRHFAFQHGSMVYNARDHEMIPNATDNPWANCPGKSTEHEYYDIHPLGWSLQLTNIIHSFDVKSESIYYGKICIKCDLEQC